MIALRTTTEHDQGAVAMVRRLSRRYLLLLAAVAVLVTVDQAVLQPLLIRLNFDAPVINLAGRQRMLSQRLTKAALALAATPSSDERSARRAELELALRQWTRAHVGLRHGDADLELPGTQRPPLVAAFAELEPHFGAMSAAAAGIVALDESDLTAASLAPHLAVLLEHEAHYLPQMDHIVGLFEAESRGRVAWLRWLGLSAMAAVLALLAVLGGVVVRPAGQLIVRQMQELESRVADRTRRLSLAKAALEEEIAQRRRGEAKNRELANELAHLSRSRALGQLAAGLAHEINQPLAAIANYAETCDLLLDRDPPEAQRARQAAAGIRQAALRAGEIIRRMRNFVRPGPPHHTPTDLRELLDDVVELCRSEADRGEVRLTLAAPPRPWPVVVDAIQIQQVAVNLLQNAIQAMEATPRDQRRLEIRLSAHDGEAVVAVRDTGPGFADENLDAPFAPFYSTKADGLGLGLAISRAIAHEHGGRLWAANGAGGGAIVTLTLPLAESHDASHAAAADCVCR